MEVTEPCPWHDRGLCDGVITYNLEDRVHLFEVQCDSCHTTWFWYGEWNLWETFDPRPGSAE